MLTKFGTKTLKTLNQGFINDFHTKYTTRLFFTSNLEGRYKSAKKNKKRAPVVEKRIDSVSESLAARGFLRSTKEYKPSENVSELIKKIFISFNLPTNPEYYFKNLEEKFNVLNACFKDINQSISNSILHEIKTLNDVVKFYETQIDKTVPLDAMKNIDLPKNLHIQYEYLRFLPETSEMFKGQTAFPKSSTLVTGLKYRNKYSGYKAKHSWP